MYLSHVVLSHNKRFVCLPLDIVLFLLDFVHDIQAVGFVQYFT